MDTELHCILEKVRKLESALTCSDCDDTFKDPVIIGLCGHTFCKGCIVNYSGKHCPTCNVPVSGKDSHEDKQLRELLSLVQELKILFEDSSCNDEDQSSDKQGSAIIAETPLQKLQDKVNSNDDKAMTLSLKKSCRVKKQPKKLSDADCNNDSQTCVTPLNSKKGFGTSTPVNAVPRKQNALASPISRKVKRSPFRSFHSFSTGKHLSSKLKSPRSNLSLSFPVNLEKKNAKGETPLHVAVIKGDVERVKMLLLKNANPNVQDNAGWTPLHEASHHGYLKITKLLVEYGALVDALGPENITPLYDALVNEKFEVAKFLVSENADLYLKVDQGVSALDVCTDKRLKVVLLEILNNCKKAKHAAKADEAVKEKEVAKAKEVATVKEVAKVKEVVKVKEVAREKRSPPGKPKLILLSTSLGDHQQEVLQNCADQVLKADIVTDFNIAVTHVVTSLHNDGQCNRTLKILQAILSGKWIVSYKWIEACLKHKKIVAEDAFEAHGTKQQPNSQGPTRARHNTLKQFPALFHGCNFYLFGQFNPPLPSKEDICLLIQIGGGKILTREPKPEMVELEKFVIPYHAEGGPLSDTNHFILYQDKPPRQQQIRANHICTVSVLWLVNSICAFTLLEPNSVTT